MTIGKKIAIGGIFLVGLLMLFIIFAPNKNKITQKNKKSPTPTAALSYVKNYLTITPESMRGKVVATLAAPLKAGTDSDITGETTFNEINGKVFVGVVLQNAPQDATYPAYIYNGTCATQENKKYSLSPVVKGRTENYIPKTMAEFKKEFPLSVKIHKSATESATFLSCADLK